MNDLSELEREIRARLDGAATRRRNSQAVVQQRMEELVHHKVRFEAFASRVTSCLIYPRMAKLASFFANAELSEVDSAIGYGCICRFRHTVEYPASVTLTLGVSPDMGVENGLLSYNLEIIPIFFRFSGHDQLVTPLDADHEGEIEQWIDRKMVLFIDTYLQLQVAEQYQQSNIVVDPVCGMEINQADAVAHLDYGGRRYFFCVDQCREKFISNPDRYALKRRN